MRVLGERPASRTSRVLARDKTPRNAAGCRTVACWLVATNECQRRRRPIRNNPPEQHRLPHEPVHPGPQLLGPGGHGLSRRGLSAAPAERPANHPLGRRSDDAPSRAAGGDPDLAAHLVQRVGRPTHDMERVRDLDGVRAPLVTTRVIPVRPASDELDTRSKPKSTPSQPCQHPQPTNPPGALLPPSHEAAAGARLAEVVAEASK
jgi:hypothetical protein